MLSSGFIYESASAAGFDLCGIARSRAMPEHGERLSGWMDAGYASRLDYMRRNTDKRADPSLLVEGARSVITCAVNYRNGVSETGFPKGLPAIASYALVPDYHLTVKQMLLSMLGLMKARHPALRGRCFTDSAPVLEKAWAVEAGLGRRGRNSLLITRQYGSFVLLGEIVVDMECDLYGKPEDGDPCGSCRRCLEACPNGAVTEGGTVDATRCIACLTIEKQASPPPKEMLHGHIFGCDICQRVCPHNRNKPLFANPSLAPVADPAGLTADRWKRMTPEEFDAAFGRTPLSRAGLERIVGMI